MKLVINKIYPKFTTVIVTMDKYTEDQLKGSLIDVNKQEGVLKDYQTVYAVGPSVRDVKVGDKVIIDLKRYAYKKHQDGTLKDGIITDNPVIGYNLDTIEVNDIEYLVLQEADIKFSYEGEEVKEPSDNFYNIEPPKILV